MLALVGARILVSCTSPDVPAEVETELDPAQSSPVQECRVEFDAAEAVPGPDGPRAGRQGGHSGTTPLMREVALATRDGQCSRALHAVEAFAEEDALDPSWHLWACFEDRHLRMLETGSSATWREMVALLTHLDGSSPMDQVVRWYEPARDGLEALLFALTSHSRSDSPGLRAAEGLATEPMVAWFGARILQQEAAVAVALSRSSCASDVEIAQAWARRVYVLAYARHTRVGAMVAEYHPETLVAIDSTLSAATATNSPRLVQDAYARAIEDVAARSVPSGR